MPVQYVPDAEGNTQRPGLITFLGVLSFLNTGFFILLYGLGMLGMAALGTVPYEEFAARAAEAMEPWRSRMPEEQYAQMDNMVQLMYESGTLLCGLLLLRTVARLTGTIGIWRARRSGFIVYASAQIIGIFLPMVVLPWSMIGLFGPLMALGMTAAFGSQLKRLN